VAAKLHIRPKFHLTAQPNDGQHATKFVEVVLGHPPTPSGDGTAVLPKGARSLPYISNIVLFCIREMWLQNF